MSHSSPELTSVPSNQPKDSFSQLMRLAWPLIISYSFTTVQLTIDRYFLTKYHPNAVSAAVSGAMIYWVPFILLFCAAGYISTFVAQYTGANKPHRVGPAIWQAIYFSIAAGLLCLLMIPFADSILGIADHKPELRALEVVYFQCLCWMALPNLLVAATSAFFSGRGDSRTVLWINGVGMVVHAILDPLMIFGYWGFSEMGIVGAGWATVIATWVSAIVGLGLVFQKKFRVQYCTLSGWRWEGELFWRLIRFGLPSGLQWMLDTLAFTAFLIMAEWFSSETLAATSLAYTINGIIFIPMVGLGQAVSILVGQRLGENRPDLAEKTTWVGFYIGLVYILVFDLLFIFLPQIFIEPFQSDVEPEKWSLIASQLRILLYFIAFYSFFDSIALNFSFALKGAGDTLFVTSVSLTLSWPLMVIPTWMTWKYDWPFYLTWGFASFYLATQALCFVVRFRYGKWKSMRVIEAPSPASGVA
jgi:multidrug resistance protein, MATE family